MSVWRISRRDCHAGQYKTVAGAQGCLYTSTVEVIWAPFGLPEPVRGEDLATYGTALGRCIRTGCCTSRVYVGTIPVPVSCIGIGALFGSPGKKDGRSTMLCCSITRDGHGTSPDPILVATCTPWKPTSTTATVCLQLYSHGLAEGHNGKADRMRSAFVGCSPTGCFCDISNLVQVRQVHPNRVATPVSGRALLMLRSKRRRYSTR